MLPSDMHVCMWPVTRLVTESSVLTRIAVWQKKIESHTWLKTHSKIQLESPGGKPRGQKSANTCLPSHPSAQTVKSKVTKSFHNSQTSLDHLKQTQNAITKMILKMKEVKKKRVPIFLSCNRTSSKMVAQFISNAIRTSVGAHVQRFTSSSNNVFENIFFTH